MLILNSSGSYAACLEHLILLICSGGPILLSQYRLILNISRSYAACLEHLILLIWRSPFVKPEQANIKKKWILQPLLQRMRGILKTNNNLYLYMIIPKNNNYD